MQKRLFGRTGLHVSLLGIGTAEIGFEDTPHKTVDAILGRALDLGVNVIDTAAMYADSEEKLGRALRGRRDKFALFTKCGRCLPPSYTPAGLWLRIRRKAHREVSRDEKIESLAWHPEALEWNIDQSLRRLKTDRLDLIQLHGCSVDALRRGEVITALQRARCAGKVRYLGYSGDGPAALFAIESGHFQAVQTSINIADQEAINMIVPRALEKGIGVIAKRPIANALWRPASRPSAAHLQVYWDRFQRLQYDFLSGNRALEMALRFALSVPGVSTAIVGTTNMAHFSQNAEIAATSSGDKNLFDSIRMRWNQVAEADWAGQT